MTTRQLVWRRWLVAAGAVALAVNAGCTRRYFRRDADKEVEHVLTTKNVFEPWAIQNFHVYPDCRSRFADPFNPDRHPMPPDDPAVAKVSPMPQKPKHVGVGNFEGTGYLDLLAGWDAENRALDADRVEREKQAEQTPPAETPSRPPASGTEPPKPGLTPSKPSPTIQPPSEGRGARGEGREMTGAEQAVVPAAGSDASLAPRPSPLAPVQYLQPDGQAQAKSPSGFDAGLRTNERPFRIAVEQAAELGLINSREFQDRREDLYLTALPVTLERFAFSAQFFATEELVRDWVGSERPDGPLNQWRATSQLGFQRLFPTGALLLFRFANQTVINLGGNVPRVLSPSTLSLDITQPLLRGGGRAVTLEALTQVERNLLYAIRAYARFRKEYFVYVAAGGDLDPNNPVNLGIGLRRSGDAGSQGYLPTLLLQATLANEQQNVAALEGIFRLYQAIQEGGDVSQLQVDQVESQLLGSRATVLQRIQDARDAIDRFKLQLGTPTALPLELDTTPIRPLSTQLAKFQAVFDQFEAVRVQATKLAPLDPRELRGRLTAIAVNSPLTTGTRFREQFPVRWKRWSDLPDADLTARVGAIKADRRTLQDRKTDLESKGRRLSAQETSRLAEIEFELDLGDFEANLRRYERRAFDNPALPEARRLAARASAFRDASGDFVLVLAEARSERIEAIRTSWPALPLVQLCGQDLVSGDLDAANAAAAQAALTNRLDLMNVRGQLVDSWRKIAVVANSLLGVADVRYHIDGITPPDQAKPFAFSTPRTRSTLTLNAELPLVRKLERNNYRAALIDFQRERRVVQATEDTIVLGIRAQVRQLRVLAENYRIQQRAVELAYFQVENSLNVLQQPPRPSTGADADFGDSSQSAGSAAALTTQLLNAQRSLPNAQNALYSTYLTYLIARMQLYRDLELLPLDARGVWTDELSRTSDAPRRDDARPAGGADPAGQPDRLPAPGAGEPR